MRYAILGDIHSNLTALETVLADIEKKGGADEIWCLGDIVGYGPDPHLCIEIIKQRCSTCVAGNHDWAAIGKMDTSYFNPEAAEAAAWTSQQLKPEDRQFLESLPLTIEKGDFTLVHGSPRDPIWEYILSAAEAEANLNYFKTPYCLVGHSHIPMLFECDPGRNYCDGSEPAIETPIKLGRKRLILNPGSIGQPRDHNPRAAYAVYDTEAKTISLYRIGYDITATQLRMQQAGLPEWLIYRLAYGK